MDNFHDSLQSRARELAPAALDLIQSLAKGDQHGYVYRTRSTVQLAAAKLVLNVAQGMLPSMTAKDVESLERLRDIQVKHLELKQELEVINEVPKEIGPELIQILTENDISIRYFLKLEGYERQHFIQLARQRAGQSTPAATTYEASANTLCSTSM